MCFQYLIVIGKVGVITCAQAREKAIEILNQVNQGIDPQKKQVNDKLPLEDFLNQHYFPWVKSNHKRADKTLATIARCFKQFYQGCFAANAFGDLC